VKMWKTLNVTFFVCPGVSLQWHDDDV